MTHPSQPIIFLYGPPGSGKSTIGRLLAQTLGLPFSDLDHEIVSRTGRSIPEIFELEGESGFRAHEAAALREICERGQAVVALGGGALLDPANRQMAEASGQVVYLAATHEALVERLRKVEATRPLLGKAAEMEQHLQSLLANRAKHYHSFSCQIDTHLLTVEQAVWEIQVKLGMFHITGMGKGYDVRVEPGGLKMIGEWMKTRQLSGPVALVSDEHIAPVYLQPVSEALTAAGYAVHPITLPPGESTKSIENAMLLWKEFLQGGLERSSTVLALGGGVISDLVGFAASIFLRGVRWVAVPTSLLAMVDASLGGKTAIDLPQGKNLVGAFYPPALVVADPLTLGSLPEAEMRNGLAEAIKHGVLRDPGLFELCARGWDALRDGDWTSLVRRAMAVKVVYIQSDPYEAGERAALNLGHTIGHAIEQASGFQIRHGEAVAIGMLAATRLAVKTGLAKPELVQTIDIALAGLGLPRSMPEGMDPAQVLEFMQTDKKKRGGQVRFVLPLRIGEARYGVPLTLDANTLREVTQ